MNSLEFIDEEIKHLKFRLEQDDVLQSFTDKDYKKLKDILQTLQQIKTELEIMEMIKNGWSGMETTISGKQIMKFQNLKLDDWIELWQRMEESLLKRSLEVKDEDRK